MPAIRATGRPDDPDPLDPDPLDPVSATAVGDTESEGAGEARSDSSADAVA
jgi:hypothetical protein